MDEMKRRGYKPDEIWHNPNWRGKVLEEDKNWCQEELVDIWYHYNGTIYPEHNNSYLKECLDNLAGKGIILEV